MPTFLALRLRWRRCGLQKHAPVGCESHTSTCFSAKAKRRCSRAPLTLRGQFENTGFSHAHHELFLHLQWSRARNNGQVRLTRAWRLKLQLCCQLQLHDSRTVVFTLKQNTSSGASAMVCWPVCLMLQLLCFVTTWSGGFAHESAAPWWNGDSGRADALERHMIKIYEKYSRELRQSSDANTVRSFRASE